LQTDDFSTFLIPVFLRSADIRDHIVRLANRDKIDVFGPPTILDDFSRVGMN